MPVNNATQIQYNTTNANQGSNTPPPAPQGKLFSEQLESNNSKNNLRNAADHTGLSQLASDDDSWHTLMGQTFGYDQSDSEGEAYTESETLRQQVLDGSWEDLGITVSQVKGDLDANAAFVGGDSADANDDGILITSETSDAEIIEEVFHAFERKINPDQEGDTRLVNDTVTFTNDESASALDEGELGTKLLSEFMVNGTVSSLSEVLEAGGITSDDTSMVTLNGERVSAEFTTMEFDEDDGLDVSDDPDIDGQYLAAVQTGNYDGLDINHAFMAGSDEKGAIAYNEDGSRDYSVNATGRMDAIALDTTAALQNSQLRQWISATDSSVSGTQGVQDFLGYLLSTGQFDEADVTAPFYGYGTDDPNAGTAVGQTNWLNSFSFEQLNNETTGTDGIRLNPEVLQHFSAGVLLALDDDKSHAESIQHALELKHLQVGGTEEIETASEVLAGVTGSPHSVHPADIVPIDTGASAIHQRFQPVVDNNTLSQLTTGVDAEGNWNTGLPPNLESMFSNNGGEHPQVIARSADNTEAAVLPDNITAIQYSYYAPKDVASNIDVLDLVGHRHDWEDVIVFVENADTDDEKIYGAAYSGHGGYTATLSPEVAGENSTQVMAQYANNTHEFYAYDGITSSMSEAGSPYLVANPAAVVPFPIPAPGSLNIDDYNDNQLLVSYGWMPDAAKTTLNANAGDFFGYDAFGKANPPMTNYNFSSKVEEAWAALGL